MPSSFEEKYPAITRWVREFGCIEIGYDGFVVNFVKAVDEGRMPWGGDNKYASIDQALGDLEQGIQAFLEENGLDKNIPPDQRMRQSTAETPRNSLSKSSKKRRKGETTPQRPRNVSARNRHGTEQNPALKKVGKLDAIATAVRLGEHSSVTRLTVLKGLCEDQKAAGEFALFLARKVQRRMKEKAAPNRYRELVNRAIKETKLYLDNTTDERRSELWSLLREIEAEQNDYENIPWGVVRNVKSFDLLVVEAGLKAVLRPYEAPFWLYYAARDYTGRTDVLPPSSAPAVQDLANFWRKYHGVDQ